MATSQVDDTFPADSSPVEKADWREQNRIIKSELTETLRRTGTAWDVFNSGELL